MQTLTDAGVLEDLQAKVAVFALFGGAHCQACRVLRPRLDAMLARDFPGLQGVYVDCTLSPALCAQHGVFSLPVVRVYLEGRRVAEAARGFGVQELKRQLERPCARWRAGRVDG